ncbi:hypothetical protein MNEG_10833 [Monoraphidium neglectum]|uniref:Uncharacterized protein n=1 Tax=Monoraphidium neglectum TaxID=145388 RepID=A0A0D2JBL5_9CHLO|nr:hypothetical protein MNEG_10833 [Monoraphidium neglectum]KIY97127.1 hypothetical protein MNEG_10833 [Monoraphidium neglectum]|eukprot:XP_013896147.1 hypothetical protein MNEG_10833 [Monoraphidium neglectum]
MVPSLAGQPRLHRGHRFVDAAVFEPIPVKSAVRDGCTHVLALCSRPASSGPAWGKLLRRTLTATVKPYMKEAWRVEHRHTTHQGQPMEEVLTAMATGRAQSTLDLSDEDRPPGGPSPSPFASASASPFASAGASPRGGSPAALASADGGEPGSAAPLLGRAAAEAAELARAEVVDMAGCRRAEGVLAADGVGGSHILPVYPSAAAQFAPVCTHVPTLLRAREDGFQAIQRVLLPALAPKPSCR